MCIRISHSANSSTSGVCHLGVVVERPVHNLYLRTKRRTAGPAGLVGLWKLWWFPCKPPRQVLHARPAACVPARESQPESDSLLSINSLIPVMPYDYEKCARISWIRLSHGGRGFTQPICKESVFHRRTVDEIDSFQDARFHVPNSAFCGTLKMTFSWLIRWGGSKYCTGKEKSNAKTLHHPTNLTLIGRIFEGKVGISRSQWEMNGFWLASPSYLEDHRTPSYLMLQGNPMYVNTPDMDRMGMDRATNMQNMWCIGILLRCVWFNYQLVLSKFMCTKKFSYLGIWSIWLIFFTWFFQHVETTH